MPITDPAPAGSGIDPNRGDFAPTAVGTGLAAAVLPVSAEAIHTDTTGLTAGEVAIRVGDFKMPACRAMPAAGAGAIGTLLVLRVNPEVCGVNEHSADVAPRSARLGHLAVAPEWFVRRCDAQSNGEIAQRVAEVVGTLPDAQALGDLDACMASMPTAGPAIAGTRPRTTGSAAWCGSRRMASREHALLLPPS